MAVLRILREKRVIYSIQKYPFKQVTDKKDKHWKKMGRSIGVTEKVNLTR